MSEILAEDTTLRFRLFFMSFDFHNWKKDMHL